jgi:hypothetical protein
VLKCTQQDLLHEKLTADELLRPHLAGYEHDMLRVCGPAYGSSRDIEGDPENHWQEWLSIFLPQLVYANPQCTVESTRPEWPPERSIAMQYELNDWAPLVDLRSDIERCASDFAVRWSCGVVQPQPIEGYEDAEDPPHLPSFTRLSPHDLRWDSTVRDWRKGRWIGHRIVRDIVDVIHEAEKDPSLGWDLKMLRQIEKTAGNDPKWLERRMPGMVPDRKQLVCWELWVRGKQLPHAPPQKRGYFGTLYTILDECHADSTQRWIRQPRPFFGPRRGPYCLQGAMLLGDLAVPLAPLIAQTAQAVYLNKIARAIMKAVHDYKRIGITTDQGLADKIEFADDGSVFSADGIDVRQIVAHLELGGLNQQLLAAKEDARATLDRNSGLHEAQRGNITGVATATEVNAAAMAGALRSGFLVEKYRDFVRQIYSVAGFYFDVDSDVSMDIGPLPFQVRGPNGKPTRYARVRGGLPRHSNWSAEDHERSGLRIDPHSMARSDEQTKQVRFALLNQTLGTLAALPPPIAVATNVPWYLKQAEEASGVRDLQRLIDPEVYYATQNQLIGADPGQRPNNERKGQPRFAWNTPGAAAAAMGPGASAAQRTQREALSPAGAKSAGGGGSSSGSFASVGASSGASRGTKIGSSSK